MTRGWAVAAFALLLATSAFAGPDLPPGKWWRRPEIVQQLGITEDQQTRLENIFRGAAADLIDLKAEVDKQSVQLRGELDQPVLNRGNIQRIAAKLNEARGHLFERELMMLIDMRGVLTDQQWKQMRAELDRMGNQPAMPRQGMGQNPFRKRQQ